MAAGWTAFAPQSYTVEPPGGLVAINTSHKVWPETDTIKNIKDELGQDVLFLVVGHRLFTHEIVETGAGRTRAGKIGSVTMAQVVDPKFVGYGVGGYGHIAVSLDAQVTPEDAPDFIKGDPSGFLTDWKKLVPDAEAINAFSAEALAVALKHVRNLK